MNAWEIGLDFIRRLLTSAEGQTGRNIQNCQKNEYNFGIDNVEFYLKNKNTNKEKSFIALSFVHIVRVEAHVVWFSNLVLFWAFSFWIRCFDTFNPVHTTCQPRMHIT